MEQKIIRGRQLEESGDISTTFSKKEVNSSTI
jgi:hypothetical protein